MAIDLTAVGATASGPSGSGVTATFGVLLPGIDPGHILTGASNGNRSFQLRADLCLVMPMRSPSKHEGRPSGRPTNEPSDPSLRSLAARFGSTAAIRVTWSRQQRRRRARARLMSSACRSPRSRYVPCPRPQA